MCEPVVPVTSVARELGCKHYSRGAQLVAACCGAAHVCRFCHDEAEDHTIDRFATREMVCMRCGESDGRLPRRAARARGAGQVLSARCASFWDDAEDAYHCPFCNVCRRGKGLGKDFFHCMPRSATRASRSPWGRTSALAGPARRLTASPPWRATARCAKIFVELGHAREGHALRPHDAHALLRGVHQALLHVPALPQVSRGLLHAYSRMLDAILAEEREANGSIRESGLKTTQRVACNDCGRKPSRRSTSCTTRARRAAATTPGCWAARRRRPRAAL